MDRWSNCCKVGQLLVALFSITSRHDWNFFHSSLQVILNFSSCFTSWWGKFLLLVSSAVETRTLCKTKSKPFEDLGLPMFGRSKNETMVWRHSGRRRRCVEQLTAPTPVSWRETLTQAGAAAIHTFAKCSDVERTDKYIYLALNDKYIMTMTDKYIFGTDWHKCVAVIAKSISTWAFLWPCGLSGVFVTEVIPHF